MSEGLKLFFQGLFAFELLMMTLTFVTSLTISLIRKETIPLSFYLFIAVLTLIIYLLSMAITFVPEI